MSPLFRVRLVSDPERPVGDTRLSEIGLVCPKGPDRERPKGSRPDWSAYVCGSDGPRQGPRYTPLTTEHYLSKTPCHTGPHRGRDVTLSDPTLRTETASNRYTDTPSEIEGFSVQSSKHSTPIKVDGGSQRRSVSV